ncbi:unnamed protein product [Phytophthora lilii]|uniref:Unnamed protein product n=1 Tax=Phytophthora lilii TaxID=2077276 RepID=A0A9W7D9K3_9STRA|nr:unnamed protein product [Phytophthora lilii]
MARKATLEQLQQLCSEGRARELQAAAESCRFDDLRTHLTALGVKVRTKEYAAYRTKEDLVDLLLEVLEKKAEEERRDDTRRRLQADETSSNDGSNVAAVTPPQRTEHREVNSVGAGAAAPSEDAERMHLIQCVIAVSDALTKAASQEHVPGLKRALTNEMAHYAKRLKHIQDRGNDGGDQD